VATGRRRARSPPPRRPRGAPPKCGAPERAALKTREPKCLGQARCRSRHHGRSLAPWPGSPHPNPASCKRA
jgi:hypothetical protein